MGKGPHIEPVPAERGAVPQLHGVWQAQQGPGAVQHTRQGDDNKQCQSPTPRAAHVMKSSGCSDRALH